MIIQCGLFHHIYYIGCPFNFHSINDNGLIPGGQDSSRRQTVFFLPIDPRYKDHEDPEHMDFSVQRRAQYLHSAWKKHQDAVFWVGIDLAIRKGLTFYQTRSNAIILQGTLPAYCIPKVVRLKTGEVLYEKSYMSPRPQPKISLVLVPRPILLLKESLLFLHHHLPLLQRQMFVRCTRSSRALSMCVVPTRMPFGPWWMRSAHSVYKRSKRPALKLARLLLHHHYGPLRSTSPTQKSLHPVVGCLLSVLAAAGVAPFLLTHSAVWDTAWTTAPVFVAHATVVPLSVLHHTSRHPLPSIQPLAIEPPVSMRSTTPALRAPQHQARAPPATLLLLHVLRQWEAPPAPPPPPNPPPVPRPCRRRGCLEPVHFECSTGFCNLHCGSRRCSFHNYSSGNGRGAALWSSTP